jgi:pyruvate dehydrogenase E2 component (dihydrolipoamide acetyltransferase)
MREDNMAREFRLPDLGEGIREGEIISVVVSVGDQVEEGQTILEVETDKATVEIPSPFTSTVAAIKCRPGDVVYVGDVLMTFSDGEVAEAGRPREKRKPGEEEATKEDLDKAAEERKKRASKREEKRLEGPVPASPATRRLARELGVDLRQVPPSGPEGLVTAEDVRALAEKGTKLAEVTPEKVLAERPAARPLEFEVPPLPDFGKWGPVERTPVRSIRRSTAKQMALAWSQIPHVSNYETADVTKLEEFRRRHKEEIEAQGGKLSLTVFALKAASIGLKQLPRFNATLDTEAGEIVFKHYYHIGVAVNTPEGLVVPVIRDVDRKSLTDLSIELDDLVRRTRERKVSLEEMKGGTFTITNVGPMGGGHFAPIINYPEVAILGLGQAKMQPVALAKEGGKGYEVVPRLVLPISLTIDHRILDGAEALQFVSVIIAVLEDPDKLLMMMV